jgi:hypothetical protein
VLQEGGYRGEQAGIKEKRERGRWQGREVSREEERNKQEACKARGVISMYLLRSGICTFKGADIHPDLVSADCGCRTW